MGKITKEQYDEIRNSLRRSEQAELLEQYAGITARPYTGYQYFDTAGNFIGDSENYTIEEVLENAGVEAINDG